MRLVILHHPLRQGGCHKRDAFLESQSLNKKSFPRLSWAKKESSLEPSCAGNQTHGGHTHAHAQATSLSLRL